MAIRLDRRIIQQTQLSGLKQVDASPFVAAGQSFAQFGKDVQNFGANIGSYLLKQKAIADDIGFTDLQNDFDAQQRVNQSKLEKLKSDPSMLIKSENMSGGRSSALTHSAFAGSINNESRLTKTAKFKNLGEAHKAQFLAYTGSQTRIAEATAKLDTTRLLVEASQKADVNSLASILSAGARPGTPEAVTDTMIENLKHAIQRKRLRGDYTPGEADAFLAQIDKKVAKMHFGRDRANAIVAGDVAALMAIDRKILDGEYRLLGEDVGEKRILLHRDFNAAQSAKESRSAAESKFRAETRAQELAKDIREGKVSQEILTDRVDQFSKGAGRGKIGLTGKLYKQIADLDKPESESPNSVNQATKNQIAAIDLTDSDAKEQLVIMREVVDAMTDSEVDSFTMKQSTDRIVQIDTAIKGLDDAATKAFNVDKKKIKDLIMIKTKPRGGFMAGLTDNERDLRIFALEYYDNLLGRGVHPKDAWNNIKEVIEADGKLAAKKINLSEVSNELGFDLGEMRRLKDKFKGDPSSLTSEEKQAVLLMESANKANKKIGDSD